MRLFVILLCMLSAALWARPINDGNKLFKNGDYAGALEKYMKAREAEPGNPLLFYNIGTCQYKLGNYDEAKKEFESAVRMPDKKMAAKAAYNLANTHFRMGEKAADAVVEARKDGPFISRDDFWNRTKVPKTVIEKMHDLGLLGDLPETNQISLFDVFE